MHYLPIIMICFVFMTVCKDNKNKRKEDGWEG